VGVAVRQIGLPILLFVIDASPFAEDDEDGEGDPALKDFKKVLINPIIIAEKGEKWGFNEGCLSIPDINEEVMRPSHVVINYLDENFEEHEVELSGLAARVVQHEYDHIERSEERRVGKECRCRRSSEKSKQNDEETMLCM